MAERSALAFVILAMFLTGCGTDPNMLSTEATNKHVASTSVDLSEVRAVEVTLVEMILFPADETTDNEEDPDAARSIVRFGEGLTLNLLDFQNSRTVTLASEAIPAGEYKKLRMYIVEATMVVQDPDDEMLEIRHPIDVPSGKVDIPVAFTVTGGENTEVVLDFDAALSLLIIETRGGNKQLILRPVVTPTGIAQR